MLTIIFVAAITAAVLWFLFPDVRAKILAWFK